MKFTILKNKLKEGINIVERISNRSISLPILNNILLSVEKNFLSLTSTDLEMGIKWWALVKTEKEGKITFPSKILSNLLNFLPDKLVSLKTKGNNLEIKCGNQETTIHGLDSEDFPIIPKNPDQEKIEIPTKVFCQALASVVDIVSFSSTKPEISGVFLSFQKNVITITATDSFRLGEKKIYLESPLNLEKEYSFIIPQKTAKEIINIFNEKESPLFIYFSPNQIFFETFLSETKHPEIQLTSRLIEGDYPDYQEIIPKKHETKVILPLVEFMNQIKSASLFSGKISEIKLEIDPIKNQVNFSSQNVDIGEYQSFLKGKIEGESCQISFNYRFLLEGLSNIKSQQEKETDVIFELSGPEKPAILKLKEDKGYLYLVMPIKNS